jgi:glycosyltransferase involved in cell wall biosynthesis
MKISIITVCYNSAATIKKTLLSVRSQTYKNIEHIIVDGKSSDGTLSIINNHSFGNLKFVSEHDKGIYDAMNTGLAMATGDIIGFLNSDDYYAYSGVIEDVVFNFANAEIDALYGDVAFFSAGKNSKFKRRYRSNFFSPSRLSWGWMPAHPTLFLHRNIFNRVGNFSTTYKIAGDFEFIARAFKDDRLRYKYIPRVLVNMQIGGASTNGLKSKIILNFEVMRACRENGLSTNLLKLLCKYPFKFFEMISK